MTLFWKIEATRTLHETFGHPDENRKMDHVVVGKHMWGHSIRRYLVIRENSSTSWCSVKLVYIEISNINYIFKMNI